MRSLAGVFCVVAVVAASSVASAAEYLNPLFPSSRLSGPAILSFQDEAPGAPVEAAPAPIAAHAEAITLYECVKYEDLDHIAPCAEEIIVKVANPCWKPTPCGCCAPAVPKCVYVAICVPKKQPCCKPAPVSCCAPAPAPVCCEDKEPKITCRDGGRYVKYDYGKYRVEIRVKGDKVVVDYDN